VLIYDVSASLFRRGRAITLRPIQTGITALVLLPAFALLALVSDASASPLFEESSVLEVTLAGPLSTLFESEDEKAELPFSLKTNDAEHAVKVRLRGKSRRRVCKFPPLRLNFSAADTAQSIFDGQDKIKLVTHCRAYRAAQVNLLEEYAAYRIFNLLSDISYRVRLLHITYTDTDGGLKESTFDRYGFVIEPASELAERVGGQAAHVTGVSLGSLNEEQVATVFVFQYLIGNTDWSLVMNDEDDTCCHNGDLVDVGSDRYYVPYDFDLSGLVNARYARPDPSLRIRKVTQRRYRGFCLPGEALENALSRIMARRADIMGTISELPDLSRKEAGVMTKYIDKFFDSASNADKLLASFERRCL